MNRSEEDIQKILQNAPSPAAPAGLKERLVSDIRLRSTARVIRTTSGSAGISDWLKRWWPVLVPAAASAACGVVLTFQQMETQVLTRSVETLPITSTEVAAVESATIPAPAIPGSNEKLSPEEELARAREILSKLTEEVKGLERLQAETKQMRARLADMSAGSLPAEDMQAMTEARDRAARIACVNNLKQLGLAARVWGVDNGDVTPPTLLSMTNEMSTPKILVCPGDTGREAAKDWPSFTDANTSYKYLLPSVDYSEPTGVLFMCPVHGSIGLVDGSVLMGVAKEHPEYLRQQQGKLIYSPPATPASKGAPTGQPGGQP